MYLIVEKKFNENAPDSLNYIGVFDRREDTEKWIHNKSLEKGHEYLVDESGNLLVCRNVVTYKKEFVYSVKRVPLMS